MVLEDEVADKENPLKFPFDMNPMASKQPGKPRYHFAISGKDVRKPCSGSNNIDVIKRNVIIGDLIQTDFSEIRIRHKSMTNRWISNRDDELNLLFTLGIVFSQALVDILGKKEVLLILLSCLMDISVFSTRILVVLVILISCQRCLS